MNTTILQWNKGKLSFDLPVLYFFFYTVGPMTSVVFFLWFVFAWWIKHKENIAQEKRKLGVEISPSEKCV